MRLIMMLCVLRGIMDTKTDSPDDHHQLVLYYRPTCPFCVKVINHLEALGKDISLKNLDDDVDAVDELIHLGGKKQVPCLFIDGVSLYESNDIIEWISEHKELID